MYDEHKEKSQFLQELHLSQASAERKSVSGFMEGIHSVNSLHLVSAMSQIFLGSFVVALSILGIIKPIWISTLMTILGSISSVIGLFFAYHILSEADTFNSLLHRAIKRVISSQN